MKKFALGFILLLVLCSMMVFLPEINVAKAEPKTIVVPDDYLTIGWAIGNASEGDTIFVKKGTYYEHVTISKSISLIGEDRYNTIIDGNYTDDVIVVTANNVKITEFTIQKSGDYPNCGIFVGEGSSGNNISYNIIINNSFVGICLYLSSNNNIISGNNLISNGYGIYLRHSLKNTVSENNITANSDDGIALYTSSDNNIISGNNITNNNYGIALYESSNNVLRDNRMNNNKYNFKVDIYLADWANDIDTSNTVDDKPIYYWLNERDRAVPSDAGYVTLVNCANITVENLTLKNNVQGILLAYTTNSTITKNNITNNGAGITLVNSSNNSMYGNVITKNNPGIRLDESSNNTISGNNITNNGYGAHIIHSSNNNTISGNTIANNDYGTYLEFSNYNKITENNITANNHHGICLYPISNNNIISGNNITNNNYGAYIRHSSNNTVSGNNIANNDYGAYIRQTSNNVIYHNNFINNTNQAYNYDSTNVWDNGYPSGGNYWDDYAGLDQSSGPYQNETGSDGIGDTSHNVATNNQDRFPLMGPFNSFSAGTWDETTYCVHTVSNSIVSDFAFSEDDKLVSFNVTGPDATLGFCRVSIPNGLLWCDTLEEWNVTINGNPPTYLKAIENTDYTYLYFTYDHSIQEVQTKGIHVIPEFPSFLILPLFMITTLLAVMVYRRKHSMLS